MSTALVVKRGARSTAEPTGYGWAVPSYTYGPPQYAPGPAPAPAWPRSYYSVFGDGKAYGNFLTESSEMSIPNWALLLGGGILLWKMRDGKSVPVRTNPYGVPFLVPALIVGGGLLAVKTTAGIGDWFTGMSGTGLFLGMALGALYGMKTKTSGATLGGAVVGWGIGMAYEKAQEPDPTEGAASRLWNWLA